MRTLESYSLAQIIITVIVIAAAIAILVAYLKYTETTIPPFVVRVFWIVVFAFVAICAIHFLFSM